MPEPTNSGKTTPPGESKEFLSQEQRLLLCFVLMGAVLFFTPYFYKTVAPPPVKKAATTTTATTTAPATAPAVVTAPAALATDTPAAPVATAAQEEIRVIDTNLFRVTFTNRGGVVKSWLLKRYKAHSGAPLEIYNTASHADPPAALFFPGAKPSADLNKVLYQVDATPLAVTFSYSDGATVAHKSFRFRPSSYLLDVSSDVTDHGHPVPNEIEWRGGFGDMGATNPTSAQQTLRFDLSAGKLVKDGAKAGKNGPATVSGSFSFAGIEDQYFVAAFLPERGASTTALTTFSDTAATPFTSKEEPFAGAAVGGSGDNHFTLYVGPKDIDVLRSVDPKLEQVVDFGWLAILSKPLFLAVNYIAVQVIHNYGWSIVLVTIALNFLLFPLKVTSMKSMKKMQALQPQINAINDKYKNVGMRDPKAADKNQEVMDLYKKYGVNPAGGCVPMLLQIPFFIAFYKVFSVSVEMRGASWLWVTDLSQPETLPIHLLPVIMVITQFAMQKMTPQAPGADPNQQRMMMFMPLIFGGMFYYLSSGLVLYYLTSNLVGIAQQWFFNKTSIATVAAQSVLPPPKKKKDGKK